MAKQVLPTPVLTRRTNCGPAVETHCQLAGRCLVRNFLSVYWKQSSNQEASSFLSVTVPPWLILPCSSAPAGEWVHSQGLCQPSVLSESAVLGCEWVFSDDIMDFIAENTVN